MTDTEILDWLSARCFYPEDLPCDDLVVLIPERFAGHGAFTCNPEKDKRALRVAIENAIKCYASRD
jgi:hypothetical protein